MWRETEGQKQGKGQSHGAIEEGGLIKGLYI